MASYWSEDLCEGVSGYESIPYEQCEMCENEKIRYTIPVVEEMANLMLSCFDKMTASQTKSILEMAQQKKTISRRDVIELLRISNNRVYYLLRKMKCSGLLAATVTRGRGARYRSV